VGSAEKVAYCRAIGADHVINYREQDFVADQLLGRHLDDGRRRVLLAGVIRADRALKKHRDPLHVEHLLAPTRKGGADGGVQQAVLGRLTGLGGDVAQLGGGRDEEESRLRAELSRRSGDRCQKARDELRFVLERAEGRIGRVHAAELAEERDRDVAGRGDLGEHAPDVGRPGERARSDAFVAQQGDAELLAGDDLEDTSRHPRCGERIDHDLRGLGRELWMPRVRLEDHRAPCSQRRSRVAADHREGEREVGCREVQDRPEGQQHAAEVGSRPDDVVGIRLIDSGVEVRTLDDDLGEEAELVASAAHLALQPLFSQAGLAHRCRNEFGSCTVDRAGELDQGLGSSAWLDGRERAGGRGGCRCDIVDGGKIAAQLHHWFRSNDMVFVSDPS